MAFQLHWVPNDSGRRSFDGQARRDYVRVFFVFIRQRSRLGSAVERGALDPGREMAPVSSGHWAVSLMWARGGDGRSKIDELLPCGQNSRKALRSARLHYGNDLRGCRPSIFDDPLQGGARELANHIREDHQVVRRVILEDRDLGVVPTALPQPRLARLPRHPPSTPAQPPSSP